MTPTAETGSVPSKKGALHAHVSCHGHHTALPLFDCTEARANVPAPFREAMLVRSPPLVAIAAQLRPPIG